MMAKISRGCGHEEIRIALALCLFGLAFALPNQASAAEPLAVTVDQATVMKLPEKVATIVVGNPLIADVAVESGGLPVVTGKGYGSTNLRALDRTRAVLMETPGVARGASEQSGQVYAGGGRR